MVGYTVGFSGYSKEDYALYFSFTYSKLEFIFLILSQICTLYQYFSPERK